MSNRQPSFTRARTTWLIFSALALLVGFAFFRITPLTENDEGDQKTKYPAEAPPISHPLRQPSPELWSDKTVSTKQAFALNADIKALTALVKEEAKASLEWQGLIDSVSRKLGSLNQDMAVRRDTDWIQQLLLDIDELDDGRAFLPGEAAALKNHVLSQAEVTLDKSGQDDTGAFHQLVEHGASPAEVERKARRLKNEHDQNASPPAPPPSALQKEFKDLTNEMVENQATPGEIQKALNEIYLGNIGEK